MVRAPFNLQDHLITYSGDRRAAAVPMSFAELGGAVCILGSTPFSDDDSVHADQWECHPNGDETLCVLEGRLLVTLVLDGKSERVTIETGQALIVPRGSWHRLQVLEPGQLLFFTPAAGTELRPRVAVEGDIKNSIVTIC